MSGVMPRRSSAIARKGPDSFLCVARGGGASVLSHFVRKYPIRDGGVMGRTDVVAHDPSAPSGHLPALRAGRNSRRVHTIAVRRGRCPKGGGGRPHSLFIWALETKRAPREGRPLFSPRSNAQRRHQPRLGFSGGRSAEMTGTTGGGGGGSTSTSACSGNGCGAWATIGSGGGAITAGGGATGAELAIIAGCHSAGAASTGM